MRKKINNNSISVSGWLKQPPNEDEIKPSPNGGLHLPIEKLRPLLDNVNYCTRNYSWNLYKDGYAKLSVAASIELEISYLNNEGVMIYRTFVGACNFSLLSIAPIQDWNATAKSMCIKNAAIEAANRFGRELNIEAVPNETIVVTPTAKPKPDIKIMKQFEDAVKNNDEAAISMLSNIYDIKKEDYYAIT